MLGQGEACAVVTTACLQSRRRLSFCQGRTLIETGGKPGGHVKAPKAGTVIIETVKENGGAPSHVGATSPTFVRSGITGLAIWLLAIAIGAAQQCLGYFETKLLTFSNWKMFFYNKKICSIF